MTPRALFHPARLARRPVLSTQSDERLVDLVRAGSDPAFEAIVERYGRALMRYVSRLLPPERAEDVVQQAFVKAYEAMHRNAAELNLRPWLYRIAHNGALNALRDRALGHAELDERIDGVERPDQALERATGLRELVVAVQALPERQRSAILLRELEGRSYEEIAASLGVTDGAVRQLLNRARNSLRAAAAAVTPMPLVTRLAAGESTEPVTARVAELAGVGGGALAMKVMATALVTGAVVGGAAVVPDVAREHSKGTPVGAEAAEAAGESRSDAGAGGGAAAGDEHPVGSTGGQRPGDDDGGRHPGGGGGDDRARDGGSRGDDGDDRVGSDDRSGHGGGPGDDREERSGRRGGDGDDDDNSGPGSGPEPDDPDDHSGPGGGGGDTDEPDDELEEAREDHSGPGGGGTPEPPDDDLPEPIELDSSGSGSGSGSGSSGSTNSKGSDPFSRVHSRGLTPLPSATCQRRRCERGQADQAARAKERLPCVALVDLVTVGLAVARGVRPRLRIAPAAVGLEGRAARRVLLSGDPPARLGSTPAAGPAHPGRRAGAYDDHARAYDPAATVGVVVRVGPHPVAYAGAQIRSV